MAHGGIRTGAGRKAGLPNKATQERQAKVAATGIVPLDVMIANMRHFHNLAESAERAISEFTVDVVADLPPEEQFKKLLAEVKKAAGLRESAQACARDAAPYIHPRLASVDHAHSGNLTVEIVRFSEDQATARELASPPTSK